MRYLNSTYLTVAFMVIAGVLARPGSSLAQDRVLFSVFSDGGGEPTGAGYSIGSTIGQPLAGRVGNSLDVSGEGFWYLQNYTPTGVNSRSAGVAKEFFLYQNYPNPFNPSTAISYQLSAISNVTLRVYDILGREVATLVHQKEGPGKYSVTFDGSRLASGVYFYRLVAGSFKSVKKLVLLK